MLLNPLQHDDWADTLGNIKEIKKPSQALGPDRYSKQMGYFSRERMVEEHVEAYKMLMR